MTIKMTIDEIESDIRIRLTQLISIPCSCSATNIVLKRKGWRSDISKCNRCKLLTTIQGKCKESANDLSNRIDSEWEKWKRENYNGHTKILKNGL